MPQSVVTPATVLGGFAGIGQRHGEVASDLRLVQIPRDGFPGRQFPDQSAAPTIPAAVMRLARCFFGSVKTLLTRTENSLPTVSMPWMSFHN
jgi:hypothetical protein